MPYLNDLENVFDIKYVVVKTITESNKGTKAKTEIKKFTAKRKNIIFKGGGIYTHGGGKTERMAQSKVDISTINTFINSIKGRIDTLERGI